MVVLLVLQALSAGMLIAKGHDHHHPDPVMSRLGDDHARAHADGKHHHHPHVEFAVELDAPAMSLDSAGLLLLLGLLVLGTRYLPLAQQLPQACPAALLACVREAFARRLERPPRR